MKKARFIILACIFVLVAFFFSRYLVPSKDEIALVTYKDKEFVSALERYKAQYNNPDEPLSIGTASKLSDVYLQYAQIDNAVEVMERFVKENPNNIEARKKLGNLYKYAQRPDDYIANLEIIEELASSPEYREKLASAYSLSEENSKNIPLMLDIVGNDGEGTPQEFRDLIRLLASSERYEEALQIMNIFEERYIAEFTFDDYELKLRLLIENQQFDEAHKYALSLREKKLNIDEVSNISNVLLYRVNPASALEFIRYYEADVMKHPRLISQYVNILVVTDNAEAAYAMLKQRHDANALHNSLYDELVTLSIKYGNNELADSLIKDIPYDALDENEVISMIDIALRYKKPNMLDALKPRAQEIATRNNDDYLIAMLTVAEGSVNSDKVVATLKNQASFAKRLQLAQLCSQRNVAPCVTAFSEMIPPIETLSDTDVVGTVQLLQNAGQYDAAYSLINRAREARENPDFDATWFPLAALKADNEVIDTFLSNEPDYLPKEAFTNAYYLAANNKSYENAGDIASYVYKKDPTGENRELITQTYMRAHQYESALPLLREDKDKSANAENDYLFVLAKLARKKSEYADELSEYGQKVLNSNVSDKRRQAIIYALVDGGQQHTVMPYIRNLALQRPNEWASLYADYLKKRSGNDAARTFWLEVAAAHNGNTKLRSQIAYNLLDQGYTQDAENLFMQLAQNQPVDSDLVKQLVYIWSPIFDDEALNWLNQRAASAATPEERQQWLTLMANGVTNTQLAEMVESYPQLLEQSVFEERYLDLVRRTQTIDNGKVIVSNYIAPRIDGTYDLERLNRYAEFASAYNLDEIERNAYKRGLALSPDNPELLARLGVSYYGEADYSRSEELLSHYFSVNADGGQADINSFYRPEFYYAELLRRDRKKQQSEVYYKRVIEMAAQTPASDVEMQSMAARAYAYTGKPNEAKARFKQLIAANPDNRQLRAEYSSMLLEMKQYDDVPTSLADWKNPTEQPFALTPLSLSAMNAASYRLVDGDTRILLKHNNGSVTLPDATAYDWLGYAQEGYQETMLVAESGYRLKIMTSDDGTTWIHPERVDDPFQNALNENFSIRNDLTNARYNVETGGDYQAAQTSRALVKAHPNNPEVLGFAANIENFVGNWPRARTLINQARNIQPENEDIITLQRGIERQHASTIYIDGEWRRLADNNEFITTIGGQYDVNENTQVGVVVQNDSVDSQTLVLPNGQIGEFNDEKQRGEVFVRHFNENGDVSQLSIFGNNDTPGIGLYHAFINPLGNTRLGAEYHRPNWDFVEGVLTDATRDRVLIGHRKNFSNQITADVEVGLNRYNTKDFDDLSSTGTITANISRQVLDIPYVAVGYGLDAEYEIDEENGINQNGAPFQRFPMDSREVHALTVFGNHQIDEDTTAEGFASYGYDRISGDSGPGIEGRITHYITDRVAIQGRAGYGFRGGPNEGDVTRAGVRLQYRY
jgi:hypothetical protein